MKHSTSTEQETKSRRYAVRRGRHYWGDNGKTKVGFITMAIGAAYTYALDGAKALSQKQGGVVVEVVSGAWGFIEEKPVDTQNDIKPGETVGEWIIRRREANRIANLRSG
jgi:hypothetical protein